MLRALAKAIGAFALCAVSSGAADAAFHLWKIQEVYSNADGSVQFIELVSPNPSFGENAVSGQQVRSTTNNKTHTIVGNLPSNQTSGRTFLIATPAYASQPGAVPPDYTFSGPNFFSTVADTLVFLGATPDETIRYDNNTMTPLILPLPTNGVHSLVDPTPFGPDTVTNDLLTVVNSPKNFAGATGTLFIPGDTNDDGLVNRTDFARIAANYGKLTGATRAQGDFNADGRVSLEDWARAQSRISPSPIAAAVVPEPSSATLLAVSLLAAACARAFTRRAFRC
jgi:hypothetical protein